MIFGLFYDLKVLNELKVNNIFHQKSLLNWNIEGVRTNSSEIRMFLYRILLLCQLIQNVNFFLKKLKHRYSAWVNNSFPQSPGFLNENLSPGCGMPSYQLLVRPQKSPKQPRSLSLVLQYLCLYPRMSDALSPEETVWRLVTGQSAKNN